jgi:hypothetical protein
MEAAAKNPGGGASEGIGLGMGFAMANQMGKAFNQQGNAPASGGPPPLPGAGDQFFVAVNGQQQGPYSVSSLPQMIQQGTLTRDSLVWRQGLASWIKAGEVSELSNLFGAAPPPLPPQ